MQAFIDGQIGFTTIIDVVSSVVDSLRASAAQALRDLADVSAAEEDARRSTREHLKKVGS